MGRKILERLLKMTRKDQENRLSFRCRIVEYHELETCFGRKIGVRKVKDIPVSSVNLRRERINQSKARVERGQRVLRGR